MENHTIRIRQFIEIGDIKSALGIALETEELARYQKEFTLLKSKYSTNEKAKLMGILAPENYDANRNQIAFSVLKILEEFSREKVEQEKGNNRDILLFNSRKNQNSGQPETSEITKRNFKLLSSLPAGFISPTNPNLEEVKQIDSVSWSLKNEYLLTNSLFLNTAHIWKVESQEIVFTLPSKGVLRKCQFVSNWIFCIEDDSKVILWEKKETPENKFGTKWIRNKEFSIPQIEGIDNPYIVDSLYWPGHNNKIYVVVQNGNDGNSATILSCDTTTNNIFTPTGCFFKNIKGIKWLEEFGLAVLHNGKIENSKSKFSGDLITLKGKTFKSSDVDVVWSGGKLVSVGKDDLCWVEETEDSFEIREKVMKRMTMGYELITWNIVKSYQHGRLIAAGSNYGEIFVGDKGHRSGAGGKFRVKFHNHKKKITRLEWSDDFYFTKDPFQRFNKGWDDWNGHFLISASEDGSIRVWHPEKEKEIGAFFNCHPVLHPFSWQEAHIAYADTNGYVHIFKRTYDPDTGGVMKKNDYKAKKRNTLLDGIFELIYGISVIGFSIYWVPKIGLIKGIGWAFVALFYWIFYEVLWIEILAPLLESIFS